MNKRNITLVLAITTAAFIACKLPSNIEVKTDNFKISIPTKTGSVNLTALINNLIKNSLDDDESDKEIDDFYPENMEIYDMPDYPGMQALLVAYQMKLTDTFNPDDYLKSIKNALKLIDKDSIGFSDQKVIEPDPIIIPELTPEKFDDYIWLDMDNLFRDMETWINTTSVVVPPVNLPLIPPGALSIPFLYESPHLMAFVSGTNDENFESVFVEEGKLRIDFTLHNCHDNASITLNGIRLVEEGTENLIGSYQTAGGVSRILSSPNFENYIEVDLKGSQIFKNSPPQLKMTSITYNNTTVLVDNALLEVTVNLSGISLSGATNLKNTTMRQNLPDEFTNNIVLDESDFPEEFLNTIIENGSLVIEIDLPADVNHDGVTTYFEGVNITYNICVKQDQFADPEIPGVTFDGLSSPGNTWIVTENTLSANMQNRYINRKTLSVVKDESWIILKTDDANGGASFNLFDNDMYHLISIDQNTKDPVNYPNVYQPRSDKVLPVKIKSEFVLNELRLIRWKTDTNELFEIPDMPEINFGNIDGKNVAEFIESIMFEDISLSIDFTLPADHPSDPGGSGLPAALQNRIAIKTECEELGLGGTANAKMLTDGRNEFASVPKLFYPAEPPLTGTPKILSINTQIIPVINGVESPGSKYIEFGPLDINIKELNIYGVVNLDAFKWEYAYINLTKAMESQNAGSLGGEFPTTRERWWNLTEAHKYLSGFKLGNNTKAKMLLNCPHQLLDVIKPDITFSLGWVDPKDPEEDVGNWIPEYEILVPRQQLLTADTSVLPVLPGENENGDYIYRGTDLPLPGQGFVLDQILNDVVSIFPKGMHIKYDLKMDERFKVTPSMFDDIGSEGKSAIEALIIMLIPLEFIGEPGAEIAFGDIFDENTDLFERKINSDGTPDNESSIFTTDVNIKKLELKIDFDKQFFSGAYFHLDKNDKLFPGGLNLNNGKNNSLTVKFSGKDWDIIKNNIIYPEMKMSFPKGTTIQIPRNNMPTRVTFSASGSYNLNLDELGLND